jgi:protein N-terminal glutamine amidohydrolase
MKPSRADAGLRHAWPYTACYCEENIWQLCAGLASRLDPAAFAGSAALFISNPGRTVAFRFQLAAPPGEMVVWDYHVVLLAADEGAWRVWDFDTRLGFIIPAQEWFERSFDPDLPAALRPRFRAVPAPDYLRRFSSDRRHMRDRTGGWRMPPPVWPLIRGEAAVSDHELERFIDMQDSTYGRVREAADYGRFCGPRGA